jgi:hypothetical protein
MLKYKYTEIDLLVLFILELLVTGLLTMGFLGGLNFEIDVVAEDEAMVEAMEPLLMVL